MFNHGTITRCCFDVDVIYDHPPPRHRRLRRPRGHIPVYTGVTALAFFAAMGLPGLSAFISEVLVLLGAWQRYPGLTIVAASAIVLTAGYLLWTLQRVWLGTADEKNEMSVAHVRVLGILKGLRPCLPRAMPRTRSSS
jgi:NADH-quinone oxidoreductase subunit M